MKSIWEFNLGGNLFSELDNVLGGLNKLEAEVGVAETKINKAFDGQSVKTFGQGIFQLHQGLSGINDLSNALWGAVEPIVEFDKKSRELQSITNVTEPILNQIKGFAKESASAFGGEASAYLESYKVLLSKLGPELANKPDILKEMGKNVAILSKSMGGDAAGAVNVLTTAMNQYGVSINNPAEALAAMTKQMNQMQAGAIVGSSELPDLQAGIAASGAMANQAAVKFSELNAALQVLDKGSKKGAEGGVALRNALGRMNEGRFMPEKTMEALQRAGVNIDALSNKSSTFADRLKELSKIKGDDALVGQFFGMENVAAGQFMLSNISLLEEFTAKIDENKNAAVDSANIVMQSHDEKISRISAFFNNIKLSIGEALGGAVPYLKSMTDVTGGLLQTMPGIVAMIDLYGMLASSQKFQIIMTELQTVATVGLTAVQEMLNAAFFASPWGWVALTIGAVVGAVIYCWNHFEGFRLFLYKLYYSVKEVFSNIGSIIWNALKGSAKLLAGIFMGDLKMIKEGWTDMQNAMSTGANALKNGAGKGEMIFAKDEYEKNKKGATGATASGASPQSSILSNPNPSKSGSNPSAFGKSKSDGSGSGSSNRNIVVNITKLVEQIHIHSTTINEAVGDIKAKVAEALIAAVGDFETGMAQQ